MFLSFCVLLSSTKPSGVCSVQYIYFIHVVFHHNSILSLSLVCRFFCFRFLVPRSNTQRPRSFWFSSLMLLLLLLLRVVSCLNFNRCTRSTIYTHVHTRREDKRQGKKKKRNKTEIHKTTYAIYILVLVYTCGWCSCVVCRVCDCVRVCFLLFSFVSLLFSCTLRSVQEQNQKSFIRVLIYSSFSLWFVFFSSLLFVHISFCCALLMICFLICTLLLALTRWYLSHSFFFLFLFFVPPFVLFFFICVFTSAFTVLRFCFALLCLFLLPFKW